MAKQFKDMDDKEFKDKVGAMEKGSEKIADKMDAAKQAMRSKLGRKDK